MTPLSLALEEVALGLSALSFIFELAFLCSATAYFPPSPMVNFPCAIIFRSIFFNRGLSSLGMPSLFDISLDLIGRPFELSNNLNISFGLGIVIN